MAAHESLLDVAEMHPGLCITTVTHCNATVEHLLSRRQAAANVATAAAAAAAQAARVSGGCESAGAVRKIKWLCGMRHAVWANQAPLPRSMLHRLSGCPAKMHCHSVHGFTLL